MEAVHHRWLASDIIGGNSALDLVNTVSGWGDNPEDWIPDTSNFLNWAAVSGLLNGVEKREAAHRAEALPVAAERVLASLKELRFALWHLTDCLEHGTSAHSDHLSVIGEWNCRLALSQRLIQSGKRMTLAPNANISAMELPGLRVVTAALPLLMNPPAERIKTCPGSHCGWKFVDRSKNKSRRWCDMAVCGNLAKVKSYRSRN